MMPSTASLLIHQYSSIMLCFYYSHNSRRRSTCKGGKYHRFECGLLADFDFPQRRLGNIRKLVDALDSRFEDL